MAAAARAHRVPATGQPAGAGQPAGGGHPASPPGRAPWLTLRRRDALAGLGFVLPQAVGFSVLVAGPLVAIFWFSLRDWNLISGQSRFIGLQNYRQFLDNPEVGTVVVNTLVFALGFVPLTVVGGLLLAVAVNRRLPGMRGFQLAFFVPVMISLPVWAVVWRLMLQPDGPLSAALQAGGLGPVGWLRGDVLAMGSVIGVQSFKTLGFAMVLFLAALQGVPPELRQAARVDGASDAQVFRKVTLPLIAPFTFLVTTVVTIASFKSFALIYLLTQGGPGDATRVMSYYIYQHGLQFFDMGFASSLSVTLYVGVLGLTVLQFVIRRRWVFNET